MDTYLNSQPEPWPITLTNITDDATTGTKEITTVPFAMLVKKIYVDCSEAPTGRSIVVDILKNGTSIFSVKPEILVSTKSSLSNSTYPVLVSDTFDFRDELTFVVDYVGSTLAGKGIKVWIEYIKLQS